MRLLLFGGAIVPLALSACALLLSMSLPGRADEMPVVGAAAPDFQVNSQEGKPVSLRDYRGKWVVLYFYPKDMTPGCTIEAHNFQRDLPKFDQKQAVILGVSVDNVDSHQQFCTKESLTFKLLADPGHTVVSEYGSLSPNGMAARNTFLIDPQGKIRKVFTKVNPNTHSEDVLASLAELQSGAGQ